MKLKNKGFTLIELLAVIVILAVIALIATPIIMNVIRDSKEGAAKDAMYGYVKAVELATINTVTATTDAPDGTYTTTSGNLIKDGQTLTINFKGTKPADGGTIKLEKGNVVEGNIKFDGICTKYDGKKVDVANDCNGSTPTPPGKTYTVGEPVYLDPTGVVADCASGKEWTQSNTETTCYKWNVIKDNGTNLEMLLDHNIGATVAWAAGSNSLGPVTALQQMKADTTSWSKVETLTSSDNVTRSNDRGSTYVIDYNGSKARLISGQEVANIETNTGWTIGGAIISITTQQWLYQNLNNKSGYWTDTIVTNGLAEYAWLVEINWDGLAELNAELTYERNNFGIRPVIKVLKSNI